MREFVRCLVRVSICTAAVYAATLPLAAQAPSGLNVRNATNKRIDLTWSGTSAGYTVQRRALGGSYADVGSVSGAAFSDTNIDAYTTYQYQVVANLNSGASAPSNQVTVGPPPAGFTTVAPAPGPAGSDINSNFAYNLSMTLDGNGDPAFAYVFYDPNADTDPADTRVEFWWWSRATYKWNGPARVAVTGGDTASRSPQTISLGYDASTGVWGLATQTVAAGGSDVLALYTSTDGATWTRKATFAGGLVPSLAMAGGNLYLAYVVDHGGLKYVTGRLSADPATWIVKGEVASAGVGMADASATPALALDSAGNPAIAYWCEASSGDYNAILMYWRPAGAGAPVRVMDSQNNASDQLDVRMVFHGLNPRVLVWVVRNDSDSDLGVHSARSDDGGATWNAPVLVPPDHSSSTDYPFDLAVDSQGRGVAAFGRNGGSGDDACGYPKVSRTNDFVTWTTCDVVNSQQITGGYDVFPLGIQTTFGGNDKLWLMWSNQDTGIILYREPPAATAAAPNIATVVNGATFQAGIVAGSWTTITGANLSGVTRPWADADFNNGNLLPTNLSGVQVKINNLDAPVYYISPT